MKFKVGFGFDVHQLKEGLDFWLGGIIVPHTKGGLGHSDADVLIHTICDALLGAANLGDIGKHFPDAQNLSGEHCSRACEVFLSLILGGAILSWLSSGVVILSWESLDSSEGEGVFGGVSREGMGWSLKQADS